MRNRLAAVLLVGGCLGVSATGAAAESVDVEAPIRGERVVSIGLSPAWPWIAAHDATIPLPAARLGVNLSPQFALDLTVGSVPFDTNGRMTLVDFGGRYFFDDRKISPYAMLRGGRYIDDADEGSDRDHTYLTAGAGIELACGCGLTGWAELGPALIRYDAGSTGPSTWEKGAYASLGLGYRFGS